MLWGAEGISKHWEPGRVQRASILVLGQGIEAPQSKLPLRLVWSPLLVVDNTAKFFVVKYIPVQCSTIKRMTVH